MLRRCVLTETIMKSFFRALVVKMPNSPLVWFAKLNRIVLPDHTTKMKMTSNWLRLMLRSQVFLGGPLLPTPSNSGKLAYVIDVNLNKKNQKKHVLKTQLVDLRNMHKIELNAIWGNLTLLKRLQYVVYKSNFAKIQKEN